MKRAAFLALIAALLWLPSLVTFVSAGPAADAFDIFEDQTNQRLESLERDVGNMQGAINELQIRVTNLEAQPSPTPTASPSPSPTPTPSPSPTASSTPTPPPSPSPTPSPSSSPSPTPSPTPSPSPTPTPTPPTGGDPWAVAFGSRPASGNLNLSGAACQNIVIENKTFSGAAGVSAIRLNGCNGVTIRAVDFIDVSGGVYAVNSSNITLVDSRYRNIVGPAHDAAGNRTQNIANLIQLNNVVGALIDHNKGRCGDTEDIVSVYQSRNVIVEDNHFEGILPTASSPSCRAWVSGSGSGIALGDSGGGNTNNIARRNILLNPGQVGAFIAGGTNHVIENNTIIGQVRPAVNVGIYVWLQGSPPCSGHRVSGNEVRWSNASGGGNPYWNAGNCGTVVQTPANTFTSAPGTILAAWRVTL